MVGEAARLAFQFDGHALDASWLLIIAGVEKEHEAAVGYAFCHLRRELLRGDNFNFIIVAEVRLQVVSREYSGGIVSP